jgi:predicted metal-dependent phosphoesterase TrpH
MLADIHIHSHHSHGTKVYYDGVDSPRELLIQAKRIGLGAVAITDHDTMKGSLEARKLSGKYGIMVIAGMEVSSLKGHILALGISEPVPKGLGVEETVDRIHQQGGVAVAAHPFDIRRVGMRKLARYCDAIETFNSQNLDRISNIKALKFADKHNIPKTAGSDAHSRELLGNGVIEISPEPQDADEILKKIKRGEVSLRRRYAPLSEITRMSVRRLKLSYDYTSRYVEEHYGQPKKAVAKSLLKLVNRSPGRIDYLFLGFTYFGYAVLMVYAGVRNMFSLDRL